MPTRERRLLLSLLGVLLVAGCTTTSEGTPKPDPGADTSNSGQSSSAEGSPEDGELPSDGAPDVKDPLDISQFLENPCLALTAGQTGELGVSQTGEPSEEKLGKVCTWRNPETHGSTAIRMIEKYRRGLSGAYSADKRGEYIYFEPLEPIEGYPAVAYDNVDVRDTGGCGLAVGVANDLMFDVALQLSTQSVAEKKDPCEVAVVVAGMMLRTMKEKS